MQNNDLFKRLYANVASLSQDGKIALKKSLGKSLNDRISQSAAIAFYTAYPSSEKLSTETEIACFYIACAIATNMLKGATSSECVPIENLLRRIYTKPSSSSKVAIETMLKTKSFDENGRLIKRIHRILDREEGTLRRVDLSSLLYDLIWWNDNTRRRWAISILADQFDIQEEEETND